MRDDDDSNVLFLIRDESMPAKRKRTYGSGTIRQRGEIFYVGYRLNGRQKWERVGPSRDAAVYRLLEIQQAKMESRQRELEGYPFEQLANEWLSAKKPSVSRKTYDLYENIVKQLCKVWKDQMLQQIDEISVEGYRDIKLDAGKSPQTIRHHLMIAQQIFKRAMRQKLTSYNPVAGVDRPAMNRKPAEPLTPAELRKLFKAFPDSSRMLFRLLLATGMREGEALALSLDDWNADKRTIWIRRTLRREGGKTVLPPYGTKTSASVRTLKIDQELADAIETHIAATADDRAKTNLKLLFPSQAGTIINPSNLRNRVYSDAAESAGLTDTRIHLLRHTWASEQIAAGKLPITTISQMLGHASPQVTLSTYSHIVARHRNEEASLSLDLSGDDEQVEEVVTTATNASEIAAEASQTASETPKRPTVSMKQVGRRSKAA